MRFIFLALLLVACGHGRHEKQGHHNPLSDLSGKKALYNELAKEVQGPSGFVEFEECDSLLFSAMVWGAGVDVDIRAAKGENGLWYRTPDHRCYDEGRSGSDTSKDMLVGLEFGAWLRNDSDVLQSIYDYGHKHKWIYGRGSLDRTYFLQHFQNTLRVLLGKDPIPVEPLIDPRKDHQRHAVALNIIMRGEVQGKINDDLLSVIEKFREADKKNALFQYAYHRFTDGDQSETIAILEDENLFPAERLPTTADRAGRWLWERESSSDHWQPESGKPKKHSGGDFTVVVTLLENSYNE